MGSDKPGRRLPGYDLLERVAVGGRGEIFLARETRGEERLVAVKLLRSEDVGRADRVQAFVDEVKVSCLLVHPNVVRVYHGDLAPDGVPYLVMEYIDGITLWELLDRAKAKGQQVPLGVAAYVTAMVADALAYAHSMTGPDGHPLGLVHRDVSTVNVMATFDGAIKLLDFGIARSNIRALRTAPGIIKGKLDYLSPEQCTGGTIDALTDIYSLGVVLFELVTRQRPYSESDVGTLFEKVARGDRPRVHELRPDVSPRLERIVDRAMAVTRSARYQSSSEMLEDLRACMARLPDVPTSSGLAELVADLAPDRVSAVQAAYGPPDTTAVQTIADLAAASAPATPAAPGRGAPPGDPAAAPPSEPPLAAAPLPAAPRPAAPPAAAAGAGSTLEAGDGPTARELPLATAPPPRAVPLAAPSAGVSPRWFLLGVLALCASAVVAGLLVTLAVRGRGAEVPEAPVDGSLARIVQPRPVVPVAAPPRPPSADSGWAIAARQPHERRDAAAADPLPEPEEDAGGPPPEPERDDGGAGSTMSFGDAAPAPVAPRGKGLLTVTSRQKAMVFLGRRKLGLTPLERLPVDPGRYRIKVRSRGGVRRERIEVVEGEETRLDFPL